MRTLVRPRDARRSPCRARRCRLHDTATGALVDAPSPRARPGCTSAASRRTTPPTWPRRDVRRVRPAQPGLARRRPRGALRAERHRRRRPAARAGRARCDVDWVELAERETELFREDMAALRVLPPDHYIGAVESIPLVIALIERLEEAGAVYRVDERPLLLRDRRPRVRRDVAAATATQMLRGLRRARRRPGPRRQEGPARLRAVARRARRASRPGRARSARAGPGWHIECTRDRAGAPRQRLRRPGRRQRPGLPAPRDVRRRGPGRRPGTPFAQAYVHAGMVGYDGEKMSKSQGNLVFVSALRNSDVDPMAIRLALLRHHYRSDWEWTDERALGRRRHARRLAQGARAGCRRPGGARSSRPSLAALADDLDAPPRVAAVDAWVDSHARHRGPGRQHRRRTPRCRCALLDAALGLSPLSRLARQRWTVSRLGSSSSSRVA